jgi:hypothetical protein
MIQTLAPEFSGACSFVQTAGRKSMKPLAKAVLEGVPKTFLEAQVVDGCVCDVMLDLIVASTGR